MEQTLRHYLSLKLQSIPLASAEAVIQLHGEDATVPFIARYRKEKTGNLDEVQIRSVIEAFESHEEIIKRKTFLIKEIGEQGNLTDLIKKRIELAWDLGELEEIYRPYKKKKKTKATIAREAGLEPLANWVWDLGHQMIQDEMTLEMKAKAFLNPDQKIQTYDDAIKGAQDILIEKIANDPELRLAVNKNFFEKGKVISKAAKGYKPNSKFEMYKEHEEFVTSLMERKATHRYLAMRRGWQEEELSIEVVGEDDFLMSLFTQFATTNLDNAIGDFLKQCAKMALQVYVIPSVTNEVHRVLKQRADEDAIQVFSDNVKKVLLSSPFGSKFVLGIDPGLRTGCKVALIDQAGNFISHTVIQILGEGAETKAKTLFGEVLKQIKIDVVAVGNGTAGRQTEIFVRKILKDIGSEIPVIMVNESGASVYSASDIAREEFPELDVTVRGAISIARRLQDPLAELVKVDPKSIGVGQYQHDVPQTHLKKSLDAVVESCVNQVGVDINTSSKSLLSFVSGIGPALADGIIAYRKENGLFSDRSELMKVPKFGTKAFEQAAGFLRIQQGKFVLDATGIHPERYPAVRDMAQDLGVSISDLIGEGAKKLLEHRTKWAKLVGEFTFDDIIKELEKPGRDPRDPFKAFSFRDDIFEVKDLKQDMICPGIVTNVTNFGAFVDIGVHQDGLVHISELSHEFIDDPKKVVSPGDLVKVKVIKIDLDRNQIALSMKMEKRTEFRARTESAERPQRPRQPQQPRTDGHQNRRPPQNGNPNREMNGKPVGNNAGTATGGAPRPPRPQQNRRPEQPVRQAAPPPPPPPPPKVMFKTSKDVLAEKKYKDVLSGKDPRQRTNRFPDSRGPEKNEPQQGSDQRDQRSATMNNPPQRPNPNQPFNNPFAALLKADTTEKK